MGIAPHYTTATPSNKYSVSATGLNFSNEVSVVTSSRNSLEPKIVFTLEFSITLIQFLCYVLIIELVNSIIILLYLKSFTGQIAGITNLCHGLSMISILETIYFTFINPFFL